MRCVCVPGRQVLLYLGDEAHRGVRACVHGGQDGDDHKQPGGRAGGVHARDHTVLSGGQDRGSALSSPRSPRSPRNLECVGVVKCSVARELLSSVLLAAADRGG